MRDDRMVLIVPMWHCKKTALLGVGEWGTFGAIMPVMTIMVVMIVIDWRLRRAESGQLQDRLVLIAPESRTGLTANCQC